MSDSKLDALSNWGRWGADDERGTLNLLSAESIVDAAALIRSGKTYSLSVPLESTGAQWPGREKLSRETRISTKHAGRASSGDMLAMHSHSGTHIDALCHIWYDGRLYNGFSAEEHVSETGVSRNTINNVPFLVGRGVLLDVAAWKGVEHLGPGEPVLTSDLEGCAAAQGVEIRAGDLLLVRTGWTRVMSRDRQLYDRCEPGIHESTLPWLKSRDIAAVGADNFGVEVIAEMPPADLPVHRIGIRDLGLYLIENLALDELAEAKAYESFVVVAPLQLTGGAGSPVNPIAIT